MYLPWVKYKLIQQTYFNNLDRKAENQQEKGKKQVDNLDHSTEVVQPPIHQSATKRIFLKLHSFIKSSKFELNSSSNSKNKNKSKKEGLVYHRPVIDCLNEGFSKIPWELSQVELNKLRLPYKGDIDYYADVNCLSLKWNYLLLNYR